MIARLNSHARSPFPLSLRCSAFVAAAMLASLSGCNEAAGLTEHQPYQGFPDSLSVRCTNGDVTVPCENAQDKPQDGHFLTARPSYDLSGAEVHDNVTGLSWYRAPGDADSHDKATEYCNVLPGDYRLPTRIELVSLLDFRDKSLVRIDTSMFPDVKPTIYWTASRYGANVQDYWVVDFCASCASDYVSRSMYVGTSGGILCVKSVGDPFETGPFVVAGVEDRFLQDTRTGLMWMKKPFLTNDPWTASLQACQKAPDGAYNDFRVPNVKELATLVDDRKGSNTGTLLYSPFEVEQNQVLWSSTPSATPGNIFTLNTTGGSIGKQSFLLEYIWTLCVRGPD